MRIWYWCFVKYSIIVNYETTVFLSNTNITHFPLCTWGVPSLMCCAQLVNLSCLAAPSKQKLMWIYQSLYLKLFSQTENPGPESEVLLEKLNAGCGAYNEGSQTPAKWACMRPVLTNPRPSGPEISRWIGITMPPSWASHRWHAAHPHGLEIS